MSANPERMRPTEASIAPHVIEANAIVFQAANGIIQEQSDLLPGKRDVKLVIAATRFLKGVQQSPRKPL